MNTQDSPAGRICALDPNVFPAAERERLSRMLREDLRRRQEAANRRDAEAWAEVRSRADWERFRAPRLAALRRSLGTFPPVTTPLRMRVGGVIEGEDTRIENLVYESLPGVFVTANLYLPSPPRDSMPAILILHSHHNPKTQGELQDMGMTWARQGCMVLVPDQLGYGERRDHPAGPRQDYRYRYFSALQLHAIGESLMGWMAWDAMRGLDLLLSRKGADRKAVIVIGSVAGGGDPASVVAALDSRVTCAIPFNFGGPQPESRYPLPEDAERSFNTMGSGSWESTRNLRLSGRDGFLPWVIVASIAPRRLIYAHEFSWDRERDPVWKRLQRVFAFYGVEDRLAYAHGAGVLTGQPPEATHCNNVGPPHRRMIYPALERWFEIPSPREEAADRRAPEALACLTPTLAAELKRRPLHRIYAEIGARRAAAFRESLGARKPAARAAALRWAWARLLGNVEPAAGPVVRTTEASNLPAGAGDGPQTGVHVERVALEVESGIIVPLLLLAPPPRAENPRAGRTPVVVGLAQEGKAGFLRDRAADVAALLEGGAAVCLPDLRGTGETRPGGSRQRQSEATSLSATELMLGETLLGARLRDLRSLLRYLRTRSGLDPARVALWADSFAPTNPPGFRDPLIGEGHDPLQSEPLNGLLALFGGLYEPGVRAVWARGMIAGYQSLLEEPFCYVPHDAVVPGALAAGDLFDVAAALAPRPVCLVGLVNGRNLPLPPAQARAALSPSLAVFAAARRSVRIEPEARDFAGWLLEQLVR